MPGIHVYAHVPFCVDPCGYCDFYRGPYRTTMETAYIKALLAEIGLRPPEGDRIETLYFGGGTPSLLSDAGWESIFARLSGRCGFAPDAEISMEANPASITRESSRRWRGFGFNRISVGIQSLNDGILRFLNRLHTADVATAALAILADAGWTNINADLIYGIPGQTLRDLGDAVDRIAPRLSHLSAYALTVEPGTPFAQRGVTPPPSDEVADQYETIVGQARRHGLERYEVSNFCRPGFECRHNLNTWRYGAYIGLGPAAVGFDGRRRYKNVPDTGRYVQFLREGRLPESEEETVDGDAAVRDRLMLGLRTHAGVELSGAESARLREAVTTLQISDCFEWSDRHVRLKPSRLILLDEILTRIEAAG